VAALALQQGYRVHGVLPFHAQDFAKDIQNSKGGLGARAEFDRLVGAPGVDAVFELPGDTGTPESRDQAYAEANRIILNHSDLLIVMVRRNAPYRYGGSVWLEEQALDQRIPVIHIPLDTPRDAELVWSRRGQRSRELLYHAGSTQLDSVLIRNLLEGILTTKDRQPPISRLTSAFLARVRSFDNWDHPREDVTERWENSSDDRIVIRALRDVPGQIDASFRGVYCWADYLARGYGEIYRGAFVLTTLLGTVAVTAAVLSIPFVNSGTTLKLLEVIVIAILLWMYSREKKMRWRLRWLNYRQLAEQFRHARYLLLLGRAIPVEVPAYMQEFHEQAGWGNWYMRAFMRQASLPNARLDRDYLEAVRWLLETRQVAYQYEYYADAREKQERTDTHLERVVGRLVCTVFIITAAYIVLHWLADWLNLGELASGLNQLKPWTTVIGALFPAGAAALSAIRNHGEYAQNALRYRGMAVTLHGVMRELAEQRGALDGDLTRAYNKVAKLAISTTAYLLQEVYQWRTILQMKGLERT
jgi:hypothetical protein